MIRSNRAFGRPDQLRSRPILVLGGLLLVGVLGIVAFLAGVFMLPTADAELTGVLFIEFVTRDVAWFTTAGLMLLVLAYVVVTHPRGPGGTPEASIAAGVTVGLAILVATLVGLLGALVAFESVSVLRFLLFAMLTMALGWVYVSLGLAIAVLGRSPAEQFAGVLGVFFVLKYLWDSAILPMGVTIVIAGDLERTFIEAPTTLEYLLVLSPNGAYAVLGDVIRGVDVGAIHLLGFGVMVAWIVLPGLVGYHLERRLF